MKDIRLPSDEALPWHARWVDAWVRNKERRHQERSEGIPSAEAVEEASDYYRGLYIDKDPDPVAFGRLLRRRGVPDWANPYDITQEDFHLLHRDGFLWADVEFLASVLLHPVEAQKDMPEEDAAAHVLQKLRVHNAQICWMMVLEESRGRWPRSLSEVHPDNLSAITLEALFNPHLALWGVRPETWEYRDFVG